MTTINKIKKWLKEEIKLNEEIVNAKDNNLEEICSDGYTGNNILPSHVKKFIADKKATQKEQELVDNYIDEIKLKQGEK